MPTPNKWQEIRNQSEANQHTPEAVKQRNLKTEVGSPVDTIGELEAQRKNLGPKDTAIETENNNTPRLGR